MTALYAYSSSDSRLAALMSDDLEAISGRRVDKVYTIDSRYVVAVVGIDITEQALGLAGYFSDRDGFGPHLSVRMLVDDVGQALRIVAEALYPKFEEQYRAGIISEVDWRILAANTAKIVVLDKSDCTLYMVEFGSVFPPAGLHESPKVTELERDVLHRFALAALAGPPKTPGRISRDELRSTLESALAVDKEKKPAIGGLGAFAMVDDGSFVLTTCFSGVIDYARELFHREGPTGFYINVMNYACNVSTGGSRE